jgi:hypothetical protein
MRIVETSQTKFGAVSGVRDLSRERLGGKCEPLSTFLQCIPQYIEVPPNIEANGIHSYFSAVLFYQSNALSLKDKYKFLFFRLLAGHLL